MGASSEFLASASGIPRICVTFRCDCGCNTTYMDIISKTLAAKRKARRIGWTEIIGLWYAPGHEPEGGGE